jgi:hypothetical protein
VTVKPGYRFRVDPLVSKKGEKILGYRIEKNSSYKIIIDSGFSKEKPEKPASAEAEPAHGCAAHRLAQHAAD